MSCGGPLTAMVLAVVAALGAGCGGGDDSVGAPPEPWTGCRLEPSGPGPAGTADPDVEVIASDLEVPWGLTFLPNGDMLVTERPGRLRLISDGTVLPDPVLEISIPTPEPLFGDESFGFEGGLLDVLLHPEFADNRQFYLFSNVADAAGEPIGRVERYVLADDGTSATLDRVIIDDLPAGLHHQGGRMSIGPDGMLYVSVGAFEPAEAQNPDSLAGSLLRLDLDGGLPADNPTPGSPVFVSGIRNSQGYDWFDDDHIVMVDHGPSGIELDMPDLRGFDEVNVVTAGDNLGWPEIWGCDEGDGLVTPVLSWEDPVPPTGAIYYRGDLIPEWTNSFLFTTVGGDPGQHIHRVVFDSDDPRTVLSHETHLRHEFGRLRTIVADPDGALYVMTSNCDNRGECPPDRDVIVRLS